MNARFYPRVELNGLKRIQCAGCGDRIVRKTTVSQLLSPFNKNANGTVKTRAQILDELRQELAAWRLLPAAHTDCAGLKRGRVTWVKGRCPVCGDALLFIGEGGHIKCGALECPAPDAAGRLLDDRETEHIVCPTINGWTVRHPLRERLGDVLMSCPIHDRLTVLDQLTPGAFRVRLTSKDPRIWEWEKVA